MAFQFTFLAAGPLPPRRTFCLLCHSFLPRPANRALHQRICAPQIDRPKQLSCCPGNPDKVLVCRDEFSKQLIAETRVPIPMNPGRAARVDYEYRRNGTANLLFAPIEGWRHVEVTAWRHGCSA
jgi:hypothetical protein